MKVVLHLSDFGWPIPPQELAGLLADVAGLAEAHGYDGIAAGDHLWQHPIMGGPEGACLEAYSTLAFLAAHTSSVRLLTLATGVHFRHPGVLAKTVTTLDVLSGGRAWLGVGAGHYREECEGLGVPFPPLATRYELLADAIELLARHVPARRRRTGRSTMTVATRAVPALVIDGGMVAGAQPFTTERKAS